MTLRVANALAWAVLAGLAACASVEPEGTSATRSATTESLDPVRVAVEDPDPRRRLAAVREIESTAVLVWLATRGAHEDVRLEALGRLTDGFSLELVLREDPSLAPHVLPRLDDPERLARILVEIELEQEQAARALARLEDGPALHDVARRAPQALRLVAIARLGDAAQLEEIARRSPSVVDRVAAVERLQEPSLLAHFALEDPAIPVRRTAVRRVADPEVLERLALEDGEVSVRLEALVRLQARGALDRLRNEAGATGRVAGLVLALREPRFEETVSIELVAASRDTGAAPLRLELQGRDRTLLAVDADADLDVPQTLGALMDELGFGPRERAELLRSSSKDLRLACLVRPTEPEDLRRLATSDPDAGVRSAAVGRVSEPEVLIRVACRDRVEAVALRAVDALDGESGLARVALEARMGRVRRKAAWRVTDPGILARVALEDPRGENRTTAVRKLEDAQLLAQIARADEERGVRYNAAVSLADDRELARLEAEGGTVGGLAACKRVLLDPALIERVGRLQLEVDRGGDDVLYRLGPEPRVIRGEWIHGTVLAGGAAHSVVLRQEWAMPSVISAEETAEWLDVTIDPEAFAQRLWAALASLDEAFLRSAGE